MKITAYLKPVCGWSGGVRNVFARYGLDYEAKLISELNDVMLADVGAEEVEEYLKKNGFTELAESA